MTKRRLNFILLFSSALITGLAVAFPKYVGFAEWISLAPLILVLERLSVDTSIKLRHAYAYGLFYFECFYAVCFHWFIYLYPLDFPGLDKFGSVLVIIVACFGLSFLQAIGGGFVFLIYTLFTRGAFFKKLPYAKPLFIALLYTFHEYTQTLGWWGVPWGRLPLGQTEYIIPIQTASLFGSYFVTFLLVLVNALIAFAFIHRSDKSIVRRLAAIAITVFSLNMICGTVIFFTSRAEAKKAETVTIGVVQGNYDSTEKWTSSAKEILNTHLELSRQCVADGAEVIVWAETALPYGLDPSGSYAGKISDFAKENQVTLLVGALDYTEDDMYNAVFCFLPSGEVSETVYYKRHLVPFGEYVPMRRVIEVALPFLSDLSMLAEELTEGDEASVFELSDELKVGSLICFDSIYENLALDSAREGASLIAISTNDSWFSDSARIYMHTNQARLRSVELGRYTARAANTGISGFISNTGEMISATEPLVKCTDTAIVAIMSENTLYTYIGNTFVYLAFALCVLPKVYDLWVYVEIKKQEKREKLDTDGHKRENYM